MDLPTAAAWRRAVLALWRGARYREERYCAIELTGVRRFDRFQDLAALPMYEEMIVTGAWWDYVDGIAGHRLGTLLRRFPREMRKEMLAWSRSDDLWKRRSAILCQLTFKKDTDLQLLYATIEPALVSKEFFLARPSAGRCGSTPGRTRRKCAGTSASTRRSSAPSRSARR